MRKLFEELKHRNVFRVGIAYIIFGWVLAQAANLAADTFHAPDWFMQMLVVVFLLGLPIALFLAWAYELTPGGVVKAEDVPADAPKDPRSGQTLNRIIISTLVIAVAGLVWDRTSVDSPTTFVAAVTDKSIAVLPFADFSPGGDQTWFADGLTDEILNALARTRELRVASRSSAFQLRGDGQNIPEVAATLGDAHILEGSVRRSGDRIRVTAQLIRASDDAHLWSETFDASSSDSIEIQESIAFEIASLLDTAMNPDELRKMVAAGTDSISAWESYIRMNELLIQSADQFVPTYGNVEMLALYEEIIAEDPAFGDAHDAFAQIALGWLDLANIMTAPAGYSTEDVEKLFADASAAATEHARSEEARLSAEILRARVQLRLTDLVDLSLALLELRPEDPVAWDGHLNALFLASRFDDARAFVQQAANHEFDRDNGLDVGSFVAIAARVDLPFGLAEVERALEEQSPSEAIYYQAHRIFLYADRVDEAAEIARRYIAAATDPTWTLMVNIRQACAEERVEDADALYANYEFREIGESRSNIQWLALQTLGRNAEAIAMSLPLDRASTLFALSGFLTYTHFDPRPYPTLAATLSAQGVMRDNPTELNFACKR